MKKIIILSLVLLISRIINGQASFELDYGTDEEEKLYYTFETNDGNFISIGIKQDYHNSFPQNQLILKINSNGEITNELVYIKPDTNFLLQYGYEKANGNYFLMGTLTDSISAEDYNVTYVCERTPELDLVWEKFYTLPEPYNHHNLGNFIIDADSILIIQGSADSSMEGTDDILLTMKLDKNGNQIGLNFYEDWGDSFSYANEMIFNNDSTAIYLFGTYWTGLFSLIEFIEMDLDLNITNYISVNDWEHFSHPPITVKIMPNSYFFQANQAVMEPGAHHDLYVKIMDAEFNTIRDTLLLFPEYVYIPYYKGIGFIDPNQIWLATFEPEFNYVPGTEVFRFLIFDSNLNLTGMKVYGGDRRYTLISMFVTSDGGCLVTGTVPDFNGSYNNNGYIIKVMPEDIITNAEDSPISNDKDVSIFPNPFDSEIRLQTARKNLTFELFNVTGKQILYHDLNDYSESIIPTSRLQSGIYFYLIKDNNQIIQSGKLIKK